MTDVYFSELCGRRATMEDTHIIDLNFMNRESDGFDIALFAIFDGHCGSTVSNFLQHNFAIELRECIKTLKNVKNALKQSFYNCNNRLEQFLVKDAPGGSTAVVALIVDKKILLIGNCGDAEAVLKNEHGIYCLTKRHRPYYNSEYARVKNAGGFIYRKRIDGLLALSRSFGDFNFNGCFGDPLVIPDPFISETLLTDHSTLIFACDGLWDVFSYEQAIRFVEKCPGSANIAELLVNDAVYERGSLDNVSAIVVHIDDLKGDRKLNNTRIVQLHRCNLCKILLPSILFSKNQLRKPIGVRKCTRCIQKNE